MLIGKENTEILKILLYDVDLNTNFVTKKMKKLIAQKLHISDATTNEKSRYIGNKEDANAYLLQSLIFYC